MKIFGPIILDKNDASLILLYQGQSHKEFLAYKFPISILMRTHDQHWSQKNKKNTKKYVPISDFATRPLNLRKPQKSRVILKT